MQRFDIVYPYFDQLLHDLYCEVERNIQLPRYDNPRTALNIISAQIQFIREEIAKKPSLSNVNLEKTVNDCFIQAKENGLEIDGVLLPIHFVENAEASRLTIANPIILL